MSRGARSPDIEPEIVYPALWPRRPLARFSTDGIECAAGRFSWTDIASVGLVESAGSWSAEGSVWRLVFRLRAEARPLPADGYCRGPEVSLWGLELPLWTSWEGVLETVRRFYRGPFFAQPTYPWRWPDRDLPDPGIYREEEEYFRRRAELERMLDNERSSEDT